MFRCSLLADPSAASPAHHWHQVYQQNYQGIAYDLNMFLYRNHPLHASFRALTDRRFSCKWDIDKPAHLILCALFMSTLC